MLYKNTYRVKEDFTVFTDPTTCKAYLPWKKPKGVVRWELKKKRVGVDWIDYYSTSRHYLDLSDITKELFLSGDIEIISSEEVNENLRPLAGDDSETPV